jgi:hypothetical protein
MSFCGLGDGPAASAAHDLLNLWLSSTFGGSSGLTPIYERLVVFGGLPPWDEETRRRVQTVVLNCLRSDASRLPAPTVIRILDAINDRDDLHTHLILESALAALSADPPAEQRALLERTIATSAEVLCEHPVSRLRAWITVHHAGLVHSDVFEGDPKEFLDQFSFATMAQTHPQLVQQAVMIAAAVEFHLDLDLDLVAGHDTGGLPVGVA